MRISDWSSDVCSSDLTQGRQGLHDAFSPRAQYFGEPDCRQAGRVAARGRRAALAIPHLRRRAGDRAEPVGRRRRPPAPDRRSEEHTSELQSLMRISYAVFCLTKKNTHSPIITDTINKSST